MQEQLATVSTKGQLVIPKPLREFLQLRPGARVTLTVEGDELRLRKADAPAPPGDRLESR